MSYPKDKTETLDGESTELLISAIKNKLSLSYEERIESHENARQLIHDLSNARKELSARS